jgi:signal transduction histidine kinase
MPTETLDEARLRRLVDVGSYVNASLDVETVLRRVLEAARDLTGARYVALGVLDADKRQLERFLTLGMDDATREAIGELPQGRGVLGVLIRDPTPVCLDDVADHPRSFGFPAGHPPMHSFLGVPILIRGEAFGNLYLTEKQGGRFDEADQATVTLLAEWAAVAIDHARLYERAEARREELERAVKGLEATVAIARALGGETDLQRVLELIVKRARALIDARSLVILLADGDELRVAATAGELGQRLRGTRIPSAGTIAEKVLLTRRPERVADARRQPDAVASALGMEASAALAVPLVFRGQALGVLQAHERLVDEPLFSSEDEALLESFAASAATAVATAQSVQRDRLQQSIASSEQERRRWARELHDETLQGLAGLSLLLSGALRGDEGRVRDATKAAVSQLEIEIENLRSLITELRPAALDELGLAPALAALVERTTAQGDVEVDLAVDLNGSQDPSGRLDPELESTVYRLVQEALTNVVRHARAAHGQIDVVESDNVVLVRVRDDGRGFDPLRPPSGFGLVGMRERVDLAGGRLRIHSAPGDGTIVEAQLPSRRGPQRTTAETSPGLPRDTQARHR